MWSEEQESKYWDKTSHIKVGAEQLAEGSARAKTEKGTKLALKKYI